MRHTDGFINVHGDAYVVNAATLQQIRALLKRSNAKPMPPSNDYVLAEELYPELNDPILRPANYLRGMRRRARLTQAQLAEKTGMKQHHISEMESGKRTITKAAAQKLAALLNTDWRRMI